MLEQLQSPNSNVEALRVSPETRGRLPGPVTAAGGSGGLEEQVGAPRQVPAAAGARPRAPCRPQPSRGLASGGRRAAHRMAGHLRPAPGVPGGGGTRRNEALWGAGGSLRCSR